MSSRDTAREYRLRAQHCLDIATDMDSCTTRMVLLDMAQAWMLLADQADRNQTTDVVYETPPANSAPRPQADPSEDAQSQPD